MNGILTLRTGFLRHHLHTVMCFLENLTFPAQLCLVSASAGAHSFCHQKYGGVGRRSSNRNCHPSQPLHPTPGNTYNIQHKKQHLRSISDANDLLRNPPDV